MGDIHFGYYANMACEWQILGSAAGLIQRSVERTSHLSFALQRELKHITGPITQCCRRWTERPVAAAWI